MATANVSKLMSGYAATRGVSQKEVRELFNKVYATKGMEKAELDALKKARTQHKDAFNPAALLDYDRTLGLYDVKGGKVVEARTQFNDTWKVDKDAGFRAKWGLKDKYDPKAPSFEKRVALAEVPSALKEKFVKFASGYLHEGPVKLTSATRILDLDKKPIGWALSTDKGNGFTAYYKNNGSPAGLSADPPSW